MKQIVIILAAVLTAAFSAAQPVIGGVNASQTEFPFIAALVDKSTSNLFDGFFCGGTHIAPDWILTAAHCMYDDAGNKLTKNDLDVALKVWKLSNPPADFDRISVKQLIVHPGYDDNTFDNDIALIQLSGNSSAPVVALPNTSQSSLYNAGLQATVAGWGIYDKVNQTSADVLRKAVLDIISNTSCNSSTSYNGDITSNMLCAGKADGSKDACQGDSGGPLISYENGNPVQIGVVSWGDDCAVPDLPGVYTRLINYINWINTTTQLSVGIQPAGNYYRIRNLPQAVLIETTKTESYKCVIYSNNSREVLNLSGNGSTVIDLSALSRGVYYLRISDDAAAAVFKVIRQ